MVQTSPDIKKFSVSRFSKRFFFIYLSNVSFKMIIFADGHMDIWFNVDPN